MKFTVIAVIGTGVVVTLFFVIKLVIKNPSLLVPGSR
jgi:hypothetical protein